jgi:hypothetical protein
MSSKSLETSTMTVKDAAAHCGTAAVHGISQQLIAELKHLKPGALIEAGTPLIVAADAATVNLLLQPAAAVALHAASAARGAVVMTVNSCYRTIAQQYILRHHAVAHMCGVKAAAPVGHSNHEGGTGIDLSDASGWKPFMSSHYWAWIGSFDPMHFDFHGPHDTMINSFSVKAFQSLWNKHNPSDPIVVDGIYGAHTEMRLEKSPAAGF